MSKGRITASEDFWAKVDCWFKDKTDTFGTDFVGDEWKRLMIDNYKFLQCSMSWLLSNGSL